MVKYRYNGEDIIVTGTGSYGDEEAVLRWRRDPKSVSFLFDLQIYGVKHIKF